MNHDLEEFLEESGMRSGNRRMSLYMQELFAPESMASDSGAFAEPRSQTTGADEGTADNSEELDLDRRAPLAMRIEVAPEPSAPAVRGSSAGSGGTAARRPTPAPAAADPAQPWMPTARPPKVAAEPIEDLGVA